MADDIIKDDSKALRGVGRKDNGASGKALHVHIASEAAAGGLPTGAATAANQLGSASIANGQATAGAASGTLVAARAGRKSVSVRNTHATDSIYIGTGTVSAANGFLLKAGESIPVNTVAAINGIRAGSNDVTVCYLEEF